MKLNYFCCIGAELKRQRIDFDYMNQVYIYVLSGTETLNQVTAANFFNDVAVSLQPNDVIFIYSGASSLYTPYKVTKDVDNNVTLSELLNNSLKDLKDLIDSLPATIGNLLSDGSIPMDTGYTPTDDQEIATKKYVDDNAGVGNLKSDGSVSMDSGYTPTSDLQIATKEYADDAVSTAIAGLGDLAFLDTVGSAQIDTGAIGVDELNATAISGQTSATIAATDSIVFLDTTDGALKEGLVSDIVALVPASPNAFTATSTISATADWDTLTTAGLYKTSGTTYVNAPLFAFDTTGSLTIKRIDGDANNIVQEWIEQTTGDLWSRATSNGGTTWTMWKAESGLKNTNRYHSDLDMKLLKNGLISTGDFFTPCITGNFSGTGSIIQVKTMRGLYNKTPFVSLYTGTAINGAAHLDPINSPYYTSTTFIRKEYLVNISAVSDGTNSFYVLIGGKDSRTDTNQSFFSYIHSENSGRWVCVTDNLGTETVTNTTVSPLVDGGTYTFDVKQKLRIEVESNTKVRFYIDDVLVATHTTNIPSFEETNGYVKIVKTAGSTARYLNSGNIIIQAIRS